MFNSGVKAWPTALSESADLVPGYQSPSQSLKVFILSQGELFLLRYFDGTDFLIHRSRDPSLVSMGSKVFFRLREGTIRLGP